MYTRDIGPRIGSKVLAQLTEDDCWDAVYDKAKASKHRANKMAGELSCFLKWCAGREGRMAGIMLKEPPATTLNSNWFDTGPTANKIGRASCRARVWQYGVELGGRRIIKKKKR